MGQWECFEGKDYVDYDNDVDVEAMEINAEHDLEAVKRYVQEKGYAGFCVSMNMAALKRSPGRPLRREDLTDCNKQKKFYLPRARGLSNSAAQQDFKSEGEQWECFEGKDYVDYDNDVDVEAIEINAEH